MEENKSEIPTFDDRQTSISTENTINDISGGEFENNQMQHMNLNSNQNSDTLKTPAKVAINMHLVHLGKILFRLSVVLTIFGLATLVSVLLTGLIYTFGILIILMSVGTVFVWVPNYWSMLSGVGQVTNAVTTFLAVSWPYLFGIAIAMGIASIVLLLFDKESRHTALIVSAAVVIVIAIIALILLIVRGAA